MSTILKTGHVDIPSLIARERVGDNVLDLDAEITQVVADFRKKCAIELLPCGKVVDVLRRGSSRKAKGCFQRRVVDFVVFCVPASAVGEEAFWRTVRGLQLRQRTVDSLQMVSSIHADSSREPGGWYVLSGIVTGVAEAENAQAAATAAKRKVRGRRNRRARVYTSKGSETHRKVVVN